MKNKQFILAFICSVVVMSANAFSLLNSNTQNKKKVTTMAVFDGYDADDGYAFVIREDENDEDSEETIYFTEITDAALKAGNLKSEDMIGKRFEITYEITEYEVEDDNGYIETFESFKILEVKKM
ncbi:hypothetical protein DFQ10_101603 [Winogradskyella eximia]|jgi:hypothetical protein|uniref:DUF3221 domain-containing protein n=1 Tax=Winogradskyella eximia TaxID=262006 RepID=A0A3D9HBH0_9FLAO|nr:hypothetical protein [Winogradskyella eximia]RED46827.1 hypothetical protein DFQ10_101603 [Winogradskyella eximia]